MQQLKDYCQGKKVLQFSATVYDPAIWDRCEAILLDFSFWLIETYNLPSLSIRRPTLWIDAENEEAGAAPQFDDYVQWYVGPHVPYLFVAIYGRIMPKQMILCKNGRRITIWYLDERPLLKRKIDEVQ